MKILAISHAYIEPFTRVGLIEKGISPGMEITVALPDFTARKNEEGYNQLISEGYDVRLLPAIFSFHQSVTFYMPAAFTLTKTLQPDIIFINNEPWSMTAIEIAAGIKLLRRKPKLIIYTCENQIRTYPFPFSTGERFVLKNADMIATITRKEGREVLNKKGYKGPIVELPLSVDTTIFRKHLSPGIRRSIVTADTFVVGYVGRLVKEKGIDVLLRAAALVKNDFHILLIGDGPQRQPLYELGKELNIENKITFLNKISHLDLPKYLCCMDTLVLPSLTTPNWKEQFGRVLIEAMACEVPVIGSSSGEIPEVIGNAGLVFDEGNINDLKEKLLLLKNDTVLRNTMAMSGRERVVTVFDKRKIMKQTAAIYTRVLNNEITY